MKDLNIDTGGTKIFWVENGKGKQNVTSSNPASLALSFHSDEESAAVCVSFPQ